jgi:Domain of unknown function (DUF4160)
VPELSRFLGIVIRMFAEVGAPHHVAHFHAYYQGEVGIFSIDPIDLNPSWKRENLKLVVFLQDRTTKKIWGAGAVAPPAAIAATSPSGAERPSRSPGK